MKTVAGVQYEKDTRGCTRYVRIDIQKSTRDEVKELLDEIFANQPVETQAETSPYNPEFVAKIMESEKQYQNGEYEVVDVENFWDR